MDTVQIHDMHFADLNFFTFKNYLEINGDSLKQAPGDTLYTLS